VWEKVTLGQLDYLRSQIREAIAEDRIVCLECGAQFRTLGHHLAHKHDICVDDYRARWGYNRLTGLGCGQSYERYQANAKARRLGTTNTREMAHRTRPRRRPGRIA
jgi:predicted transcriptional regulator